LYFREGILKKVCSLSDQYSEKEKGDRVKKETRQQRWWESELY